MCCGHGLHPSHWWSGCCVSRRRFIPLEEELELLKRYKNELEEEITYIKKRIEQLEKATK